ncbi:MAG: hypothetical protein DRQ62_05695 [Gammaproteobacteria bacterium]|nr:MAG: hypothetical protein DRQ62_05695 [Gammaproteobacteria bacterium]
MKIMRYRKIIRWAECLILTLFLLISAATLVINNAGKLLVGFIEDQAVPYVLKTGDVAMGCVMAEALTLLIPSFSQINAPPHKLEVIFNFLSGTCAEFQAMEEELRYLRAVHIKNVTEAQDARILQKRHLNRAAQRQLKGYLNLELAYPERPGNVCPEFANWNEEFYWLVGLMDGLQAVLNDLASEGSAQVPLDISLKVGRGAACLNDEQWWGVPSAIQSAIWISFPSDKPEGIEPLILLDKATQTGLQQGMRIVQVIAAKIYIGLGDTDQVKEIIRNNGAIRTSIAANPDFLFLDKVATIQLQAISDYLWTEATGKRTPAGGLGNFWDDPVNTLDTIDIVDIL